MKTGLSLILIFIALYSNGQTVTIHDCESNTLNLSSKTNASNLKKQPLVYLDSVLIPFNMIDDINKNDILSIDVVKSGYNSTTNTEGKIYITTKRKNYSKFLYNYATKRQ